MKHSILDQQISQSPLQAQAVLRPKQAKFKSPVETTLLLTSLVDAFSILVIYLLVNTSASTETLDLNKEMQLPLASQSTVLEAGTVVKIEEGKYFIDGEEIAEEDIVATLQSIKDLKGEEDPEKLNLIIQADKAITYRDINPILIAGSQSGFNQLRFAVIQKGEI